jgi:alkylhydroperoxidase family enzyme
MTQRIDYGEVAPGAVRAMNGLEKYLNESSLEAPLIELIKLRASQINGCACSETNRERTSTRHTEFGHQLTGEK